MSTLHQFQKFITQKVNSQLYAGVKNKPIIGPA